MKRWTYFVLGILFFIGYAQDWNKTAPVTQKKKTNILTNFVTRKYPPVPAAKQHRSPASQVNRDFDLYRFNKKIMINSRSAK